MAYTYMYIYNTIYKKFQCELKTFMTKPTLCTATATCANT